MVTKITQHDDTFTLTIEIDKLTAKRLRFDETTAIRAYPKTVLSSKSVQPKCSNP